MNNFQRFIFDFFMFSAECRRNVAKRFQYLFFILTSVHSNSNLLSDRGATVLLKFRTTLGVSVKCVKEIRVHQEIQGDFKVFNLFLSRWILREVIHHNKSTVPQAASFKLSKKEHSSKKFPMWK